MKKHIQVVGYLVGGLAFFYAFFLWQFPYDRVKGAAIQSFEETLPLNLSIGRVGPSFPFRLRFEDIRIESGLLSFQIPDLTLRPVLLSLFLGRMEVTLKGSKNPERFRAEFEQEKSLGRVKIWLHGVEIQASSPKEFSCLMKGSGEASLQWPGENWEKISGQAWALLERGEIPGGQNAQIPLPLTLFDTMRAEAQVKEGVLRLKRLELSGKDLKASLPKEVQFPLKGGSLPPDLGLVFQPIKAGRVE